MCAEKLGDTLFVQFSASDCDGDFRQMTGGNLKFHAIQFQKKQPSHCSGLFVAIHERVVLHHMKQIGGRHFKRISVQPLSNKHGLGLSQSRLQQSWITEFRAATITSDLVQADLQHIIHTQKI